MNKIIMSLLILFSITSCLNSQELDFSSIRPDDKVYSTIQCNMDGDNYSDYIVNFITQADYQKKMQSGDAFITVDNSYLVTVNKNGIDIVYHIDNSRYQFFSIKEYKNMSTHYINSQIGELRDFFFVKDFNKNGIDEIFFIEFAWYEEYFIGYELHNGAFEKVLDIDINGIYKNNFKELDSEELVILRGAQYPGSQQPIEPGVYRDWTTYLKFNSETSLYEESKTVEVITKRDDFF